MLKLKKLTFILAALCSIASINAAEAPAFQLPTVSEINVEFSGYQNLSNEAVLAHIKTRIGDEYNQTVTSQSIRSLYQTGYFDSIRVRTQDTGDNEVILTYVLSTKPTVCEICFEGNSGIASSRLLKEICTKVDEALDGANLNADDQKLVEYYTKRGFSNVEVEHTVETNEDNGTARVCFSISEGRKVKIAEVRFCGHEPCEPKDLYPLMNTRKWTLMSFFNSKGRYQREVLQEDIAKLKQHYRDLGFLDVEIPESEIIIEHPIPSKACITLNIKTGKRYHVGEVSITGNTLYPTDRLMELVTTCKGDCFSPKNIDATEERLRDAYGQVGYLDTYAVAKRIPNLETGCIDLEYQITESDKYCVESIKIQGNCKTKANVILRELALAPGDVFDLVRMKSSQRRLENTRYFDEVSLIPEQSNIPGRRNLLIGVKEARTGNVTFGASFNSVEKVVGTVDLSQNNFDITNYKSRFQGAGQKFRLQARFGKRGNKLDLSFIEPWVCERELEWGINLYRHRTDYDSSRYNQTRIGFSTYFRKRLFDLVEGTLSYGLEEVDIFNVDEKERSVIKEEEGKRTISKLGFGLSYDTRDNYLYPTEGTLLEFNSALAGGVLGGATKYVQLDLTAANWFTLCDSPNVILLLGGSTGTIMSYGNQRIPFFDRFFLGGPDDIRGYNHRDVGPKDSTNEPIGGNTFFRFTAEATLGLIDLVRLAVFYDGGFVNASDLNWSVNNYNDNWGVGLRIFIMGAPLRLDWGFPLKGDGINDREPYQFNVSFGVTF